MDKCASILVDEAKARTNKTFFNCSPFPWDVTGCDTKGYCETIGDICQFRYSSADFLVKGTFGTVFKATITERGDFSGQSTVTVKVFYVNNDSGSLTKQEKWEKMGKELQSTVKLRHNHVVEYHQVKTTRTLGGFCIELMMDYYDGESLASLLRRQRKEDMVFDIPSIARCGVEIADGLAYLHAQQIVHGALKPESVLIKQTGKNRSQLGRMIIGDLDDFIQVKLRCTSSFDLAQQDVGIRYMSPEMLTNVSRFPKPCPKVQTGRRCDVWSLGCIMLDLVHGVNRQIQKVINDFNDVINAEDISIYRYVLLIYAGYVPYVPESIPETLAACIRKTLRFKSADRISAAELRDQLQLAASSPGCWSFSQIEYDPLQPSGSSPEDYLLLVGPAGQ